MTNYMHYLDSIINTTSFTYQTKHQSAAPMHITTTTWVVRYSLSRNTRPYCFMAYSKRSQQSAVKHSSPQTTRQCTVWKLTQRNPHTLPATLLTPWHQAPHFTTNQHTTIPIYYFAEFIHAQVPFHKCSV